MRLFRTRFRAEHADVHGLTGNHVRAAATRTAFTERFGITQAVWLEGGSGTMGVMGQYSATDRNQRDKIGAVAQRPS